MRRFTCLLASIGWIAASIAVAQDAGPNPKAKGPIEIELKIDGGRIIILGGDDKKQPDKPMEKPSAEKPASNAAAVERLEKIQKQLHGPADQLDLKDIAKQLAEVTQLLKGTPKASAPAATGPRFIAVPNGPGDGWGGPGSAPWMPGLPTRPGGIWLPDDFRQKLPAEIQKELNKRIEEKKKADENKKGEVKELEVRLKALADSLPKNKITIEAPMSGIQRNVGMFRLGIAVETPAASLAEQLQLPKGQGLLIVQVAPGSQADKAGLKAHDVLLKLNNRPVPNSQEATLKLIEELGSAALDATILRRGKEEIVKSVALAKTPTAEIAIRPMMGHAADLISIARTGERINVDSFDGVKRISVTGTLKEGQFQLERIVIHSGGERQEFDRVDNVPAGDRPRVNRMIAAAKI